ncbi:MAG: 8-oxo-dGTP diphosphatase [Frankiales bacterium]|nr:8-oxo-dGTP diphosphatase [Frankiales bacterium]MDX6210298.1 8-oxo-dGTP diphosphatase [Frankiales bacterium]MDX6213980.1 8-oxo-dGTP diphosphatase [Frankiales bacterium]
MSSRPGEAEFLASYDPSDWPAFAVTVDIAIFTIRGGALTSLLVQRRNHPYRGFWALPGGHVGHDGENAEQAARRELGEETGIDWSDASGHLEQVATYTDADRDPRVQAGLRVVSVAYFALAPDLPDPHPGVDASEALWWPVDDLELPAQRAAWDARTDYVGEAPPLAYDHALILSDALERVRAKLEYTTLAAEFVQEPFSLAELRRVYQAVWGTAPDLGNFRRKVLSTEGFVVPLEKAHRSATEAGGRPPLLYRRGDAQWLYPPMLRRADED